MRTTIALVLFLFVFSGVSAAEDLTPKQVKVAIEKLDETLAGRISALDDNIRAIRQGLSQMVGMGYLEPIDAMAVQRETMIADYFMTKAWAALVEGELVKSKGFAVSGEESIEAATELVKKKLDTPKGTEI